MIVIRHQLDIRKLQARFYYTERLIYSIAWAISYPTYRSDLKGMSHEMNGASAYRSTRFDFFLMFPRISRAINIILPVNANTDWISNASRLFSSTTTNDYR
jgi:hypothetical protein